MYKNAAMANKLWTVILTVEWIEVISEHTKILPDGWITLQFYSFKNSNRILKKLPQSKPCNVQGLACMYNLTVNWRMKTQGRTSGQKREFVFKFNRLPLTPVNIGWQFACVLVIHLGTLMCVCSFFDILSPVFFLAVEG